ncbi:acyltransferase family protein [Cryobacterium sp. Y50]|uniref:acyltransferase family protein n=1 Tax=Cryobacterium sp. Y50 TaxID=2048286 RepID=UPI0013049E00|nr:acyltransferase family protein [Cryobacterium sp. Y50]
MTDTASFVIRGTPREAWIDVAKGIAITLVVLYHSVMYLDRVGLAGTMAPLNPLLDTFRLPLFFFMSGILAAKAIRLPYWQLFRQRMSLLLYLYTAWVAVQTLFLLALPPIGPDGPVARWSDLVTLFIRPNINLWFIYALPIFLTVAWLTRRWHPLIAVSVTGALAVLFGAQILHTATPWDKMGRYLVFFLAAIWLGPRVRHLIPRVRWWHMAGLCGVYAGVVLIMVKLSLTKVPFVLLAVSVLAVLVGISAAVVLSRAPVFDFMRVLGSRTLPIYLVHTFPMAALAAIVMASGATLPTNAATAVPLLLCGAAIGLALATYRRLAAVPGVFTVPVASWAAPPRKAVREEHSEPFA